MTILIRLTTPTELATFEGCAMALTLASFGQSVQLMLGSNVLNVLFERHARMPGMLQSLALYDMPKAWIPADVFSGWVLGMLSDELVAQLDLMPEPDNMTSFSLVFSF